MPYSQIHPNDMSQDRYKSFMTIMRQFRYIKMLKRGGRGHDPTGAVGTKEGECAVRCAPCPNPGINLPDGWQDATPEVRYVVFTFDFLVGYNGLPQIFILSFSCDRCKFSTQTTDGVK
jgi:hypothetical protein